MTMNFYAVKGRNYILRTSISEFHGKLYGKRS